MGGIFRAVDVQVERQVALKILKTHLKRDVEIRLRFEQEALALKRLQHKNITAVRDFGVRSSEPYIVMEYIDGQTLAETIGELTYIPVERFVPVMLQVCEAMAHAHSQGVLHRDIKPANIMLIDMPRERDVVKVLDFGLAKIIDDAGAESALETSPGDPIGTPLYMSPEQAQGTNLDARSDVYSLGCVMYECLTGVPPFSGAGVVDILKKQVSQVPPPMLEVRPFLHIPTPLVRIVEKCMRKERAERYNSMIELQDDLNALGYSKTAVIGQVSGKYLTISGQQRVIAGGTPLQTEEQQLKFWNKLFGFLGQKTKR